MLTGLVADGRIGKAIDHGIHFGHRAAVRFGDRTDAATVDALLDDLVVTHFGIIPRRRLPLEVVSDGAEMTYKPAFQNPDLNSDPMEADVMARTLRNGPKRLWSIIRRSRLIR